MQNLHFNNKQAISDASYACSHKSLVAGLQIQCVGVRAARITGAKAKVPSSGSSCYRCHYDPPRLVSTSKRAVRLAAGCRARQFLYGHGLRGRRAALAAGLERATARARALLLRRRGQSDDKVRRIVPSMSGPSITWSGFSNFSRASSVSSTTYLSIPFTRAYPSRFSIGNPRHSSLFT